MRLASHHRVILDKLSADHHTFGRGMRLLERDNMLSTVKQGKEGENQCAHRPAKYTLLLLLFASTKFCDLGFPTILRVLFFAISRSRAKFCDFAQAKVKGSTLKSTGLVNAAVSRLKLLQCKYM